MVLSLKTCVRAYFSHIRALISQIASIHIQVQSSVLNYWLSPSLRELVPSFSSQRGTYDHVDSIASWLNHALMSSTGSSTSSLLSSSFLFDWAFSSLESSSSNNLMIGVRLLHCQTGIRWSLKWLLNPVLCWLFCWSKELQRCLLWNAGHCQYLWCFL